MSEDETKAGNLPAGPPAGPAPATVMPPDPAPSRGIEALLSVQMAAAHKAAMDCLMCTTMSGITVAEHERALRHAERLMALCVRQTEALRRHRAREAKLARQRGARAPADTEAADAPGGTP